MIASISFIVVSVILYIKLQDYCKRLADCNLVWLIIAILLLFFRTLHLTSTNHGTTWRKRLVNECIHFKNSSCKA